MRVVAISDTHDRHAEISVPDGDVLIHAGDFTSMGRTAEIASFAKWLHKQPHQHKLVVPGNHDLKFEHSAPEAMEIMLAFCPEARVLDRSEVIIEGVKFFGDPYTPVCGRWAFQYGLKEARGHWAMAPKCDVLVTHGPPKGILDSCSAGSVGCPALLNSVLGRIRPQHHVFGHIHESPGSVTVQGVRFHNVSMLDGHYAVCDREPIEFDVEPL